MSTLMLTWQRDPTTTMTVQWLQRNEQLPLVSGQVAEPAPYQVPYLQDISIDGDVAGWWEHALAVDFMADDLHRTREPNDLDARMRLAWDERGLIVGLRVRDDQADESSDDDRLWVADSVELFVSTGVGSPQRYQVIATPGKDIRRGGVRHSLYDRRAEKAAQLHVQIASRATRDGYVMEFLLPWSNLGVQAAEGMELGFQNYVNDTDMLDRPLQWVSWHPSRSAATTPTAMQPLQLAANPSAPIIGRSQLVAGPNDTMELRVHTRSELAGEVLTLSAGDRVLAQTTLQAVEQAATATLVVPSPPSGRTWGALRASVGEGDAGWVQFPGRPAGPMPVYYQREGDAQVHTAWTIPLPMDAWPGQFRQRVELTDLQPDSLYHFRIADHERVFRFRTMPAEQTRPIRFAAGGDTRHQQAWMEKTNRVAMQYDPDFVVWGGDLAYANGLQDNIHMWREWFQANHDGLISEDGRVVPILAAIGNHEVQGGYYSNHDGFEPTAAWRRRIAPYYYQFFGFPGSHFGYGVLDFGRYMSIVLLDTDHTTPVEGDQTRWLERILSQRRNVPHVFPVYHVPAYPSVRAFTGAISTKVRENWAPLFDASSVRVAFENHDHVYKRSEPILGNSVDPKGVVYLGDGAWGVGVRTPHDPAATWYLTRAESIRHAIIVTLDGDRQHFLVVSEDGDVIDEYESTARRQ